LRRTLLVLSLFALFVAVATVFVAPALARPAATTGPAATDATRVTVKAWEYGFTLSKKIVPRGKVTFVVTNIGDDAHDFRFTQLNKKTRVLRPGQRQTITVNFTKKGRFQYLCSVGEHFFRGMHGRIRIR
jgi:plastocyanin